MTYFRVALGTLIIAGFGFSGFTACGEAEKKGNPALVKAAEKMAADSCACVDAGKKDCMSIEVDGKKGMALYMKTDTKDLTKEELKKFGEARSRWNDCFKPGYKKGK